MRTVACMASETRSALVRKWVARADTEFDAG